MVILSIDIGKKSGVAVNIDGTFERFEELDIDYKSLAEFGTMFRLLLDVWRPDLVLAPYPTRHYWTILNHGKVLGVIDYLCGKKETPIIHVQDRTCKKVVLKNGNARKDQIADHYREHPDKPPQSEHVYDAMMFVDWYLIEIKKD